MYIYIYVYNSWLIDLTELAGRRPRSWFIEYARHTHTYTELFFCQCYFLSSRKWKGTWSSRRSSLTHPTNFATVHSLPLSIYPTLYIQGGAHMHKHRHQVRFDIPFDIELKRVFFFLILFPLHHHRHHRRC